MPRHRATVSRAERERMLAQKEAVQMERARIRAQKEAARLERERQRQAKADTIRDGEERASQLNQHLAQRIDELNAVLEVGLKSNPVLDFDSLRHVLLPALPPAI